MSATWADLIYEHRAVRSDGAQWVDGERDDNADDSWLTVDGTKVSLGPGLYDQLLVVPREASEEEIKTWAALPGPMFDATPFLRIVNDVDNISVVAQKADEISQTVAQVFPDGTSQQSSIQQLSDQIALRLQVVDSQGNPIGRPAQIAVTQVDGQGYVILDVEKTISPGSITAREIGTLGGETVLDDDGVHIYKDAVERIRVGNVGGLQWGENQLPPGTPGMWGEKAGAFFRGYARLLDAGYAEDEEDIDLSDYGPLGEVEILVAPKDMVTYSPERDTVSRMYVDVTKKTDTLYTVKAKVMVEGQEHMWGSVTSTRDPWTYIRPTGSIDGKKGVYTDFIICRPTWFVDGAGLGAYTARLWMDITNEFDQLGDPINWQTIRTFARSSAGEGTLNWDTPVEYGQWAVRVRGQGGGSVLFTYAKTGLNRLGYRTNTTYLYRDGTIITDPDPGSVPSGMSVLYVVLDRG